MWGGTTAGAQGRCGVARSDYYKSENTDDEGRAPGVGRNNLPYTMENHGRREDESQCINPTTGCDVA